MGESTIYKNKPMLRYDPIIHHRRSIRLKGYDYSQQGAYFLTLCVQHRECLFGEISDGVMRLNEFGEIVLTEWQASAHIRTEIELGEFVVMPNHFHAIVFINVGATGSSQIPILNTNIPVKGPKSASIGALMSGFKSSVTKQINVLRATPRVPVWQRNYWEHIIRDERSMLEFSTYIENNPFRWKEDSLFAVR
jgi:REP element-mobilizing transposase RayT